MKKLLSLLLPLTLLSAGCNLNIFSKSTAAGIIKTVNGGADWQFFNAIKDNRNASLASVSISKLGFDPQNREVLFAGSYAGGLYKSTDSAASWSRILSKIGVYDFAVNPFDPKIIYVSGAFGGFGKVLKTVDGGGTWEEIYNDPNGDTIVRGVAINPDNSNQVVIGTSSGTVIKSADGGLSWQLAKNFNDRVNRIVWQNNTIYILLRSKGLFKASGNFAENFEEVTASLSKTLSQGTFLNNTSVVDSYNQFYVDPVSNNLMYATTSKGLYKSTDSGANWIFLPLPTRPDQTSTWAIAVSKTSSNIIYASIDGTIYKSADGGASFQTQSIATAGLINYILIDPQLPQIAYAGIYANQ